MPPRYLNPALFFLLGITAVNIGYAEDASNASLEATSELLSLSWEELTALDISSLARKKQSIKHSPMASFVITSEDIRRSGATSLPEILRMVPGMNVAKFNSWNWAVSARGLNDLYANKLQVMIDGRSIYDPLTSGVYWGQQSPFLQDIERIEVIRGPSGSLWGANSVNGTINVVTHSAADTQGGSVYGGGGSEDIGFGGLRYGKKISESTYARVYAQTMHRDQSIDANGKNGTRDFAATPNGGFRLDSQPSERDSLMLEGTVSSYDDRGYFLSETLLSPPYRRLDDSGLQGITGSLQGKWQHQTQDGHEWRLNTSLTQTEWQATVGKLSRSTYVLDFQHSLPAFANQNLLWGLNYQNSSDEFKNTLTLGFNPNQFTQHNIGIFLQDEITLLPNQLSLTIGNRVEHFTYTGWETEPNARLLWTLNKQHSLWAGVSRAVSLPSRAQHSIDLLVAIDELENNPPLFMRGRGNPNLRTENLLAFELGWRWEISQRANLDTALFYNIFDRIQGAQFIGSPQYDPRYGGLVWNGETGNFRQVDSYGVEVSANYRVNSDWRLQASYTGLQVNVKADPNKQWFSNPYSYEKLTPHHTLSVRSQFNVTRNVEFDAWVRYTDQIQIGQQVIPDYLTLDLRLGWHPTMDLELALVGQNLLDGQHPEFSDNLYLPIPSQVQRAFLAKLSWQF